MLNITRNQMNLELISARRKLRANTSTPKDDSQQTNE